MSIRVNGAARSHAPQERSRRPLCARHSRETPFRLMDEKAPSASQATLPPASKPGRLILPGVNLNLPCDGAAARGGVPWEQPGLAGPSLAQRRDPRETPSLPRGWGFLLLPEPHAPCSTKGLGFQPRMPRELHVPSRLGQPLSSPWLWGTGQEGTRGVFWSGLLAPGACRRQQGSDELNNPWDAKAPTGSSPPAKFRAHSVCVQLPAG